MRKSYTILLISILTMAVINIFLFDKVQTIKAEKEKNLKQHVETEKQGDITDQFNIGVVYNSGTRSLFENKKEVSNSIAIQMIVLDVDVFDHIENHFVKPGKDRVFYAVKISIKNNLLETIRSSRDTSAYFNLITVDGFEIRAENTSSEAWSRNRLVWGSEEIPSGETRQGWVVFSMPINKQPKEIQYLSYSLKQSRDIKGFVVPLPIKWDEIEKQNDTREIKTLGLTERNSQSNTNAIIQKHRHDIDNEKRRKINEFVDKKSSGLSDFERLQYCKYLSEKEKFIKQIGPEPDMSNVRTKEDVAALQPAFDRRRRVADERLKELQEIYLTNKGIAYWKVAGTMTPESCVRHGF